MNFKIIPRNLKKHWMRGAFARTRMIAEAHKTVEAPSIRPGDSATPTLQNGKFFI